MKLKKKKKIKNEIIYLANWHYLYKRHCENEMNLLNFKGPYAKLKLIYNL